MSDAQPTAHEAMSNQELLDHLKRIEQTQSSEAAVRILETLREEQLRAIEALDIVDCIQQVPSIDGRSSHELPSKQPGSIRLMATRVLKGRREQKGGGQSSGGPSGQVSFLGNDTLTW